MRCPKQKRWPKRKDDQVRDARLVAPRLFAIHNILPVAADANGKFSGLSDNFLYSTGARGALNFVRGKSARDESCVSADVTAAWGFSTGLQAGQELSPTDELAAVLACAKADVWQQIRAQPLPAAAQLNILMVCPART